MKSNTGDYSLLNTIFYFPAVLFIMLCRVVLTAGSVKFPVVLLLCRTVLEGGFNFKVCRRNPIKSVRISMKDTEQYFPVVLFIMLYKVA